MRFIRFTHDDDALLMALWIVHTHVARELHTTPRLQIDALVHGSGKTTAMEHLEKLCINADLNASTPTVALIARMIDSQPTTLLFDEIHRTLDPKDPETKKIYAIIDSGYRVGRQEADQHSGQGRKLDRCKALHLRPGRHVRELARDSPESASRMLRINLLPDMDGSIEDTEWWNNEPAALALAEKISDWANSVREQISVIPVDKPEGCRGRMWEKWRPLLVVAQTAGGRWPAIAGRLIGHDIEWQLEMAESDMGYQPRPLVLLDDLHALWDKDEKFLATEEILRRLMEFNKAFWSKDGDANPYGKDLTAKALRRMIANAARLTPQPKDFDVAPVQPDRGEPRGYFRKAFIPLWRRLRIADEQADEGGLINPMHPMQMMQAMRTRPKTRDLHHSHRMHRWIGSGRGGSRAVAHRGMLLGLRHRAHRREPNGRGLLRRMSRRAELQPGALR